MNTNTLERAAQGVRSKQSSLALRKESLSALAALLAWVVTLIAENADTIPAAAGTVGQVVAVATSALAFGISRFTVPALTRGQQQRLVAEAERIELADSVAAKPATLPVYTGPTVNEGKHRAD